MEPISAWIANGVGSWLLGKTLDGTGKLGVSVFSDMSRKGTVFLNHDPRHSNQYYSEVGPKLGGALPYWEIADFTDDVRKSRKSRIIAHVNEEPFFTQASDFEWAQARSKAYLDYRADGHAASDSPVLRVEDAAMTGQGLELRVRPTRYFCQAESNLVLDREVQIFSRDKKQIVTSLRKLLAQGADSQLPPLSDRRLANSLGVAICFLSKNNKGQITLRMVHRSKEVGVFPSGVHPAMSCAIKWDKSVNKSPEMELMEIISQDIDLEMEQETGLAPSQYSTPVPISFCREFLRGGKPQLFCLSYTDLSEEEIIAARDRQMAKNKKNRPEKVELLASGLLSARNPSMIIGKTPPKNLTHEGAAALHLVDRLFRA